MAESIETPPQQTSPSSLLAQLNKKRKELSDGYCCYCCEKREEWIQLKVATPSHRCLYHYNQMRAPTASAVRRASEPSVKVVKRTRLINPTKEEGKLSDITNESSKARRDGINTKLSWQPQDNQQSNNREQPNRTNSEAKSQQDDDDDDDDDDDYNKSSCWPGKQLLDTLQLASGNRPLCVEEFDRHHRASKVRAKQTESTNMRLFGGRKSPTTRRPGNPITGERWKLAGKGVLLRRAPGCASANYSLNKSESETATVVKARIVSLVKLALLLTTIILAATVVCPQHARAETADYGAVSVNTAAATDLNRSNNKPNGVPEQQQRQQAAFETPLLSAEGAGGPKMSPAASEQQEQQLERQRGEQQAAASGLEHAMEQEGRWASGALNQHDATPAIEVTRLVPGDQKGEQDFLIQLLQATGSLTEAQQLIDGLIGQGGRQRMPATLSTKIGDYGQVMPSLSFNIPAKSDVISEQVQAIQSNGSGHSRVGLFLPQPPLLPPMAPPPPIIESSQQRQRHTSSVRPEILDEIVDTSVKAGTAMSIGSKGTTMMHYLQESHFDQALQSRPIGLRLRISPRQEAILMQSGKLVGQPAEGPQKPAQVSRSRQRQQQQQQRQQLKLATGLSGAIPIDVASSSSSEMAEASAARGDDRLYNNHSYSTLMIRAANAPRKIIANYSHWINHEIIPTRPRATAVRLADNNSNSRPKRQQQAKLPLMNAHSAAATTTAGPKEATLMAAVFKFKLPPTGADARASKWDTVKLTTIKPNGVGSRTPLVGNENKSVAFLVDNSVVTVGHPNLDDELAKLSLDGDGRQEPSERRRLRQNQASSGPMSRFSGSDASVVTGDNSNSTLVTGYGASDTWRTRATNEPASVSANGSPVHNQKEAVYLDSARKWVLIKNNRQMELNSTRQPAPNSQTATAVAEAATNSTSFDTRLTKTNESYIEVSVFAETLAPSGTTGVPTTMASVQLQGSVDFETGNNQSYSIETYETSTTAKRRILAVLKTSSNRTTTTTTPLPLPANATPVSMPVVVSSRAAAVVETADPSKKERFQSRKNGLRAASKPKSGSKRSLNSIISEKNNSNNKTATSMATALDIVHGRRLPASTTAVPAALAAFETLTSTTAPSANHHASLESLEPRQQAFSESVGVVGEVLATTTTEDSPRSTLSGLAPPVSTAQKRSPKSIELLPTDFGDASSVILDANLSDAQSFLPTPSQSQSQALQTTGHETRDGHDTAERALDFDATLPVLGDAIVGLEPSPAAADKIETPAVTTVLPLTQKTFLNGSNDKWQQIGRDNEQRLRASTLIQFEHKQHVAPVAANQSQPLSPSKARGGRQRLLEWEQQQRRKGAFKAEAWPEFRDLTNANVVGLSDDQQRQTLLPATSAVASPSTLGLAAGGERADQDENVLLDLNRLISSGNTNSSSPTDATTTAAAATIGLNSSSSAARRQLATLASPTETAAGLAAIAMMDELPQTSSTVLADNLSAATTATSTLASEAGLVLQTTTTTTAAGVHLVDQEQEREQQQVFAEQTAATLTAATTARPVWPTAGGAEVGAAAAAESLGSVTTATPRRPLTTTSSSLDTQADGGATTTASATNRRRHNQYRNRHHHKVGAFDGGQRKPNKWLDTSARENGTTKPSPIIDQLLNVNEQQHNGSQWLTTRAAITLPGHFGGRLVGQTTAAAPKTTTTGSPTSLATATSAATSSDMVGNTVTAPIKQHLDIGKRGQSQQQKRRQSVANDDELPEALKQRTPTLSRLRPLAPALAVSIAGGSHNGVVASESEYNNNNVGRPLVAANTTAIVADRSVANEGSLSQSFDHYNQENHHLRHSLANSTFGSAQAQSQTRRQFGTRVEQPAPNTDQLNSRDNELSAGEKLTAPLLLNSTSTPNEEYYLPEQRAISSANQLDLFSGATAQSPLEEAVASTTSSSSFIGAADFTIVEPQMGTFTMATGLRTILEPNVVAVEQGGQSRPVDQVVLEPAGGTDSALATSAIPLDWHTTTTTSGDPSPSNLFRHKLSSLFQYKPANRSSTVESTAELAGTRQPANVARNNNRPSNEGDERGEVAARSQLSSYQLECLTKELAAGSRPNIGQPTEQIAGISDGAYPVLSPRKSMQLFGGGDGKPKKWAHNGDVQSNSSAIRALESISIEQQQPSTPVRQQRKPYESSNGAISVASKSESQVSNKSNGDDDDDDDDDDDSNNAPKSKKRSSRLSRRDKDKPTSHKIQFVQGSSNDGFVDGYLDADLPAAVFVVGSGGGGLSNEEELPFSAGNEANTGGFAAYVKNSTATATTTTMTRPTVQTSDYNGNQTNWPLSGGFASEAGPSLAADSGVGVDSGKFMVNFGDQGKENSSIVRNSNKPNKATAELLALGKKLMSIAEQQQEEEEQQQQSSPNPVALSSDTLSLATSNGSTANGGSIGDRQLGRPAVSIGNQAGQIEGDPFVGAFGAGISSSGGSSSSKSPIVIVDENNLNFYIKPIGEQGGLSNRWSSQALAGLNENASSSMAPQLPFTTTTTTTTTTATSLTATVEAKSQLRFNEDRKRRRDPPVLLATEVASNIELPTTLAFTNPANTIPTAFGGKPVERVELSPVLIKETISDGGDSINIYRRGSTTALVTAMTTKMPLPSSTSTGGIYQTETGAVLGFEQPATKSRRDSKSGIDTTTTVTTEATPSVPDKRNSWEPKPMSELPIDEELADDFSSDMMANDSQNQRTSSLSPLVDEFRTKSLLRTLINLGVPSGGASANNSSGQSALDPILSRLGQKTSELVRLVRIEKLNRRREQIKAAQNKKQQYEQASTTAMVTTNSSQPVMTAVKSSITHTTTTVAPPVTTTAKIQESSPLTTTTVMPRAFASTTMLSRRTNVSTTTIAPTSVATAATNATNSTTTTTRMPAVKTSTIAMMTTTTTMAPHVVSTTVTPTRPSRWRSLVGEVKLRPLYFENSANKKIIREQPAVLDFTSQEFASTRLINSPPTSPIPASPKGSASTPPAAEFYTSEATASLAETTTNQYYRSQLASSAQPLPLPPSTEPSISVVASAASQERAAATNLVGTERKPDDTNRNEQLQSAFPSLPPVMTGKVVNISQPQAKVIFDVVGDSESSIDLSSVVQLPRTPAPGSSRPMTTTPTTISTNLDHISDSFKNGSINKNDLAGTDDHWQRPFGTRPSNQLRNQRHSLPNFSTNSVQSTNPQMNLTVSFARESYMRMSHFQRAAVLTIGSCCSLVVICLLVIAVSIKCRSCFGRPSARTFSRSGATGAITRLTRSRCNAATVAASNLRGKLNRAFVSGDESQLWPKAIGQHLNNGGNNKRPSDQNNPSHTMADVPSDGQLCSSAESANSTFKSLSSSSSDGINNCFNSDDRRGVLDSSAHHQQRQQVGSGFFVSQQQHHQQSHKQQQAPYHRRADAGLGSQLAAQLGGGNNRAGFMVSNPKQHVRQNMQIRDQRQKQQNQMSLRQRISGTITSRLLRMHLPRLWPYFAMDAYAAEQQRHQQQREQHRQARWHMQQQQQHQVRIAAMGVGHGKQKVTSGVGGSRYPAAQTPAKAANNRSQEFTIGDLLDMTAGRPIRAEQPSTRHQPLSLLTQQKEFHLHQHQHQHQQHQVAAAAAAKSFEQQGAPRGENSNLPRPVSQLKTHNLPIPPVKIARNNHELHHQQQAGAIVDPRKQLRKPTAPTSNHQNGKLFCNCSNCSSAWLLRDPNEGLAAAPATNQNVSNCVNRSYQNPMLRTKLPFGTASSVLSQANLPSMSSTLPDPFARTTSTLADEAVATTSANISNNNNDTYANLIDQPQMPSVQRVACGPAAAPIRPPKRQRASTDSQSDSVSVQHNQMDNEHHLLIDNQHSATKQQAPYHLRAQLSFTSNDGSNFDHHQHSKHQKHHHQQPPVDIIYDENEEEISDEDQMASVDSRLIQQQQQKQQQAVPTRQLPQQRHPQPTNRTGLDLEQQFNQHQVIQADEDESDNHYNLDSNCYGHPTFEMEAAEAVVENRVGRLQQQSINTKLISETNQAHEAARVVSSSYQQQRQQGQPRLQLAAESEQQSSSNCNCNLVLYPL